MRRGILHRLDPLTSDSTRLSRRLQVCGREGSRGCGYKLPFGLRRVEVCRRQGASVCDTVLHGAGCLCQTQLGHFCLHVESHASATRGKSFESLIVLTLLDSILACLSSSYGDRCESPLLTQLWLPFCVSGVIRSHVFVFALPPSLVALV